MADPTPLERVRAEYETELSRLGSEKSLIAATDATLEPDVVLGALVDALTTGRDRLATWADVVEDPNLADALADAASRLGEAPDRHSDVLPSDPTTDAPIGDYLEGPSTDLERAAAGLLGLPLVLDPLLLGGVSFFVNEAETATAEALRDCRSTVSTILDDHGSMLADRATDAETADAIVEAAGAVIEAAYADYADSLAAMGLDPKPIC